MGVSVGGGRVTNDLPGVVDRQSLAVVSSQSSQRHRAVVRVIDKSSCLSGRQAGGANDLAGIVDVACATFGAAERIEIRHHPIAEKESTGLIVSVVCSASDLAGLVNRVAVTFATTQRAEINHVGAVIQKRVGIPAAIGGVTGDQPGVVDRK